MPSLALKMNLLSGWGITPPIIVHLPSSGVLGRRPKRFELTLEEIGAAITVIARRRRHAKHN